MKFNILDEIEKSRENNSKNIMMKSWDAKNIQDNGNKISVSGYGFYNKAKDKRYLLEINLKNKGSGDALNIIMFNPSEKDNDNENIFIDKTITNLIKIVNDLDKYKTIKVFNLFPKKDSSPRIIKDDQDDKNLELIKNFIKDGDVMLAWGSILNNRSWIQDIKNKITAHLNGKTKIYTFCANTKRKYPKHPSNIDIECCRHCWGRKGKITLENYKLYNNP